MQKFEKFGKYYLLEKVSEGGMAEIYLATSPGAKKVQKFFAIKRILPHFRRNEKLVKMFIREAKLASNLTQNNIVNMFEFGIHKNCPYIVMEFLHGITLSQLKKDLISRGEKLSYSQAAYIISEAANGLNYAHFQCNDATTGKALNIIHRDVSPQNIMITFDGEIKVIDFGIAKPEISEDLTSVGVKVGKVSHMSPEQATTNDLDHRTDIFSLGIIAWEIITQKNLFLSKNFDTTLTKVMKCKVKSLEEWDSKVPKALSDTIAKALMKDREDRYQTAEKFSRDLKRFIGIHEPDFFAHDFRKFMSERYEREKAESIEKLRKYTKLDTLADDLPLPPVPIPSSRPPFDESDQMDRTRVSTKQSSYHSTESQHWPSYSKPNPTNGSSLSGLSSSTLGSEHQNFGSRGLLPKVLLLCMVLPFGYWLYQYLSNSEMALSRAPASVRSSQNLGIESEPAGAQLWIKGKPLGLSTPASIDLSQTKDVTIELRKSGYRTQNLKIDPDNIGERLKVVLEKIDYSYVDIYVEPSTDIRIQVDGQSIPVEEIPVLGLMIEANRSHVLEVKNLKSNKVVRKKIRLNKEGFKELRFNLE